jgi:hypothetical protein
MQVVDTMRQEMVMPFVIPPLVKIALAAFGGVAAAYWTVREMRRVNEELERVKAQPAMDDATRRSLPTLRRDAQTGEWRVV